MRRSDYVAIAGVWRESAGPILRLAALHAPGLPEAQRIAYDHGAVDAWHLLRVRMADMLADGNPGFDRPRFYAACEGGVDPALAAVISGGDA